ncbi:MAG: hypothetical protein RR292_03660, partial [Christensenellaceae bacterium]
MPILLCLPTNQTPSSAKESMQAFHKNDGLMPIMLPHRSLAAFFKKSITRKSTPHAVKYPQFSLTKQCFFNCLFFILRIGYTPIFDIESKKSGKISLIALLTGS